MSETCDRCGKRLVWERGASTPFCVDCSELPAMFDTFRYGDRFYQWLDRVIDRRVQKALVERRLP